jgi:hypothetical protein
MYLERIYIPKLYPALAMTSPFAKGENPGRI